MHKKWRGAFFFVMYPLAAACLISASVTIPNYSFSLINCAGILARKFDRDLRWAPLLGIVVRELCKETELRIFADISVRGLR